MGIGRMTKCRCSGHFGEIMMFSPTKDPFNAGLFLPVRKQFPKGA
jgi:hypothetical protein